MKDMSKTCCGDKFHAIRKKKLKTFIQLSAVNLKKKVEV